MEVSTSPVVIVTFAGPEPLEVDGRRVAVDADVGDAAPRADQVGGKLEGGRHADRFDREVDAQPSRELHDRLDARTKASSVLYSDGKPGDRPASRPC